jgi:hypothetical protein
VVVLLPPRSSTTRAPHEQEHAPGWCRTATGWVGSAVNIHLRGAGAPDRGQRRPQDRRGFDVAWTTSTGRSSSRGRDKPTSRSRPRSCRRCRWSRGAASRAPPLRREPGSGTRPRSRSWAAPAHRDWTGRSPRPRSASAGATSSCRARPAGKTWAARGALALMQAGRRVGVTALSPRQSTNSSTTSRRRPKQLRVCGRKKGAGGHYESLRQATE